MKNALSHILRERLTLQHLIYAAIYTFLLVLIYMKIPYAFRNHLPLCLAFMVICSVLLLFLNWSGDADAIPERGKRKYPITHFIVIGIMLLIFQQVNGNLSTDLVLGLGIIAIIFLLIFNQFSYKEIFGTNNITSSHTENHVHAFIVAGLVILLSLIVSSTWWENTPPYFTGDSGVYVLTSTLDYDNFAPKLEDRSDLINYGYPTIINLTGRNIDVLVALQHILRAFANGVIVLSLWNMDKNISIIAGMLLSVLSASLSFANTIWTESLYISCMLFAVAVAIFALQKHHYRRFLLIFLTGCLIGIAFWIRPIGILLIGVFIIWQILLRVRLIEIAVLIIGFGFIYVVTMIQHDQIEASANTIPVTQTVAFGFQFIISNDLIKPENGEISYTYLQLRDQLPECNDIFIDMGVDNFSETDRRNITHTVMAWAQCGQLHEPRLESKQLVEETLKANPISFISAYVENIANFILTKDYVSNVRSRQRLCTPPNENGKVIIAGWSDSMVVDFYCNSEFGSENKVGLFISMLGLSDLRQLPLPTKLLFLSLVVIITFITSTRSVATLSLLCFGIIVYHSVVVIAFSTPYERYEAVIHVFIIILVAIGITNITRSVRQILRGFLDKAT